MNFHVVPQLLIFLKLFIIITVKKYERVVGWEGSDAVSPPRDGAAWTLRNSTIILEGLRALQVSLSAKQLTIHLFTYRYSQSNIVKPGL